MTYHETEAGDRHLRRMLWNYARTQAATGRTDHHLLEFTGMSADEFEHWSRTGEVSDRWLRVAFHGHELRREGGWVVLVSKFDITPEMTRVQYADGWRAQLVSQVRRIWPGFADVVEAYAETQVPAW
jgi:hypothetical protein